MNKYKVRYYVVQGGKRVFQSFSASKALQWAIDNDAYYVANERVYKSEKQRKTKHETNKT